MRIFMLIVLLMGMIAGSSVGLADNIIQVGRYTTVNAVASKAEINPLDAIVEFHFPPTVQTVGGAVTMLLATTGFHLAYPSLLSSNVQQTLQMPLPITDRILGPLSIQNALTVLMGQNVYALQVDFLKRTINFTLLPAFQELGKNKIKNNSTQQGSSHGHA